MARQRNLDRRGTGTTLTDNAYAQLTPLANCVGEAGRSPVHAP